MLYTELAPEKFSRLKAGRPALLLVCMSFLSAGFLGCGDAGQSAEAAQEAQVTQAVKRAEGGALILAEGSREYVDVEPLESAASNSALRAPARVDFAEGAIAHISSPLEGRITKVHVKEGQEIKANEPVLTLQSPEASAIRAEIARLEIPLKSARAEVARQERLVEREVGVQAELLAAEVHLAEVENELKRARDMAAFLGPGSGATVVIRAPISGSVLALNARVGGRVDPGGDALAMVGDASTLRVVADVFERDLAILEVGAEAKIRLGAAQEAISGKVEQIGTVVDRSLRRAPVYISLDLDEAAKAPLKSALRPGMFARVDIDAASHEGLSVPTGAVLIKDRGHYVVYVEVEELKFEAKTVQIGPTVDGRVQVLSGLEPGDRIVTRGGLLLDNSAEQLL